ncbi:hypothetical protein CTAYLR_010710, partial [Chrysophaeum taylorii]
MVGLLLFVVGATGNRVVVDREVVCAYEAVRATWEASVPSTLELLDNASRSVAVVDRLSEYLVVGAGGGPPRVGGAVWYPETGVLEILFDEETNAPALSENAWARAVRLEPAASGTFGWRDPRRLEVVVADAGRIDAAARDGSLEVVVGAIGSKTVRVGPPGAYQLGVARAGRTTASARLVVEECGDEVVVHETVPSRSSSSREPFFEVGGVVATPGTAGLKVRVPSVEFSASFWFCPIEGPTGNHRALFFKGDPQRYGGQRTPSAWLLPFSDGIALRASTATETDVGVDAENRATPGRFSHLCFSFSNASYELFVDGRRVAGFKAAMFGSFLPNDAELSLFKDPERPGVRGLASDVKLWPFAMDAAAAAAEFRASREKNALLREAIENERGLFSTAEQEKDEPSPPPLRGVSEEDPCARLALLEARADSDAKRRAAEIVLYGSERDRPYRPASCLPPPNATRAVELLADGRDGAAKRTLAVLYLSGRVADATSLRGLALAHAAASLGDARAALMLATRYERGWGVAASKATAAWYARLAATTARAEFHTPGRQTRVEVDALSDARRDKAEIAQRGEDDAMMAAQVSRAESGDVDALVATGDLLYWGGRGLARDHPRARRYFERAANAGHAHAQYLYASMLLRGEGGEADHGTAIQFLERAARSGSVRALNGLGYEYFYGHHHLPKNLSKAYLYFSEAARLEPDGDSLFNAAHCLHHGLGVSRDSDRAASFYEKAARAGHFDAAFELATLKYPDESSLSYFMSCARAGWLANDLRDGFERYLAADYERALYWYAEASETNAHAVAHANAAWLVERKLATGLDPRLYRRRKAELSDFRDPVDLKALGDACAFHDDKTQALRWYARADTPDALFSMADIHATLGAYDTARRLYDMAAARDPDNYHARLAAILAKLH